MRRLLRRHVVSEMTARRYCWVAAFLLLAACTALVLKALPDLNVWASFGLVSAVALAWLVIGALLPRMIQGEVHP